MSLLFAIAIAAAYVSWLLISRSPSRWVRPQRGGPRITDPRTQGMAISRLWQLHSAGCHCGTAQLHDGRRMLIDEARPLAARDRHGVHCRCHYRPLRDQRRTDRRRSNERRGARRNDFSHTDRRLRNERRRPQPMLSLAQPLPAH